MSQQNLLLSSHMVTIYNVMCNLLLHSLCTYNVFSGTLNPAQSIKTLLFRGSELRVHFPVQTV